MDWKRQTYIWQNSRRTNLSTSCVENHSRCHLGMLYRRKRERCWANPASGVPKSPGWPQNHLGCNWNSNSSLIKEGLCSRKSFAPSVCVGCVIQGVPKAGSAAHPTEAQREREGEQLCSYNSPTLRAVRGDKPRDFPPLWWKLCLLLLPGTGNPGEGTDPWYSQRVTTQALMENSSGKAKPATNTTAEQAGIPYSKVSNTYCLSCTVFIKK